MNIYSAIFEVQGHIITLLLGFPKTTYFPFKLSERTTVEPIHQSSDISFLLH